ncbi:hypothetical protein D3C87_1387950 [compost metagenome]
MFKFVAALLVLVSAQISFANSSTLCTRPYSNDIFKTDLRLAVSKENNGSKYLWLDTHIPYGIRPLPYKIEKLACTDSSLTISAKSEGNDVAVLFTFTQVGNDAVQQGTILYTDADGNAGAEIKTNCTIQAVQDFCKSL